MQDSHVHVQYGDKPVTPASRAGLHKVNEQNISVESSLLDFISQESEGEDQFHRDGGMWRLVSSGKFDCLHRERHCGSQKLLNQ